MMTEPHGHYVRAWVSRHDNGWEAWVCEDEHGDFHAWACQSGAATVKRDAVEDTETPAKDAALLALFKRFLFGVLGGCFSHCEFTSDLPSSC